MKTRLIPFSKAPRTSWPNGGGWLRELLSWPDAGADTWRWRVSVADIEKDGPFSHLPGVQRVFAIAQGGGIVLNVEGVDHLCVTEDEPFVFSGGDKVDSRRVDGFSQALNLQVRNGRGAMQHARNGEVWRPESSHWGFYAMGAARCVLDGQAIDVPAETLLWVEDRCASAVARPSADGASFVAWWISADLPDATAGTS